MKTIFTTATEADDHVENLVFANPRSKPKVRRVPKKPLGTGYVYEVLTARRDQFESLSPGMRREILRSGSSWDDFDHARPDPHAYQGSYVPDARRKS